MVRKPECSPAALASDEPAVGTAAEAVCWVVLEQPGPWGRVAATESHLDPDLGRYLDRVVGAAGGRFALLRQVGEHADAHRPDFRPLVLIAGGRPEAPWLLRGQLAEAADLFSLPTDHLGDATPDAVRAALPGLAPVADPVLLVCTNGRRDLCCAAFGRPVAESAAAARPGRVFETTHTGGHRFAPTAVLLPSGQTYARLTPDTALAALDAADRGEIAVDLAGSMHDRGRSAVPKAGQAAEFAVRHLLGDRRLSGYAVAAEGPDWRVTRGSESWLVEVTGETTERVRPESCGKAPAPVVEWRIRIR
ncbi:sucrase ferredoxin [Granulicoccus phenolivorans]|uniref:sucrase ferredoxin n=1 Tax=Granulicoccus phenolivorans TaxID=266854 RepID=UPI0006864444|nr:sucrase ferredoxin [Granulicoccus phenolivorans]